MLATYTFWDGIWTVIVIFAWLMFLVWVLILLMDNFRRTDHGGWAKAGWAVFIIFVPLIGAVTYTIVRPESAADYGYEPGFNTGPSPTSAAGELTRLNDLRTQGAITDAEFEQLKQRTIAASWPGDRRAPLRRGAPSSPWGARVPRRVCTPASPRPARPLS